MSEGREPRRVMLTFDHGEIVGHQVTSVLEYFDGESVEFIEAQPILAEMKDLETEWETAESERKQAVAERERMLDLLERSRTAMIEAGWRNVPELNEIEAHLEHAGRNQPKEA